MTNLANGLPFDADRPPLRVDEGGVVRVGNTRISLDLIVEQSAGGDTKAKGRHALVSGAWQVPASGAASARRAELGNSVE
jgi:hypothetical protein